MKNFRFDFWADSPECVRIRLCYPAENIVRAQREVFDHTQQGFKISFLKEMYTRVVECLGCRECKHRR